MTLEVTAPIYPELSAFYEQRLHFHLLFKRAYIVPVLRHTSVCVGIYLTMVMTMAACSIIVCVFVLDLHHRNSNSPVPLWVRWLLLKRLSRCLGFSVRHHELGNPSTGEDRGGDCTNDRHQRGRSSVAGNRAKENERHRTTGLDISTDLCRRSLAELERTTRRQNLSFIAV